MEAVMSKDATKKPQNGGSSTHVYTFRSEVDKSVGVSVWLAEAPNGGPAYLYYEQSRTYESKQTKKPAYSKKFFARNAEAHAEAILQAKTFIDSHSGDPVAAIEAAKELREERETAHVNGEATA